MKALRIIAVILGGLLAATGLTAIAGGAAFAVAQAVLRDDDGFLNTRAELVETPTSAVIARFDLSDLPEQFLPDHPLGTVKITVSGGERPVFIGIAPAEDVATWLDSTAYDRLTGVRYGPFATQTVRVDGSGALGPPTAQTFWTVSASGTGEQSITWPTQPGDWTFVLANSDGQPGVGADVAIGAKLDLLPAAGALAIGGLALLALGLIVMLFAVGRDGLAGPSSPVTTVPGAYPARLDAQLDPSLSRWMWLVKWFLAIPHVFVVALLWLAVVPLTVIAGIAILFTGKYPRGIFNFNVGVMRWTWRVSYYAFNVLGTDRYPPFSLASDPDYPADFTVDYPQRLSRGLVLVKWWLLAIPQYIIVGILAGGGFGYATDSGRIVGGFSLIGILVLIAAVVLLFTGRYQTGLYDLVMGLNRWCYRVLAYAALLRDEYPPLRLDSGGRDPGTPSHSGDSKELS